MRYIEASQDIGDVYVKTKAAIMPQIFFMIGAKGSGKTTLGSTLAERTNMHLMDFS